MKELAEFYQHGLQLQNPKAQGDKHLGFRLPHVYLGFDEVDADPLPHPGAISLWFRVDNIERAFERFKDLGAEVKYPPAKKQWGDVLASVLDPDGNMIGLAQR